MDNPPPFTHEPLDSTKQQIRLFIFRPHISNAQALQLYGNEGIHGRPQVFDVSGAPPYQALSYVWGSEEDMQEIFMNGKLFRIRKNLHEFFRAMRRTEKVRLIDDPMDECYFWIDQICIDQSNVRERGHQVNMMAGIYSQAERVISWLGNPVDHITLCPPTDNGNHTSDMHASLKEEKYALLRHWASFEYWDRLWIVQEVLLAKDLLVTDGEQAWSSEDMDLRTASYAAVADRLAWQDLPLYLQWRIRTLWALMICRFDGLGSHNRLLPLGDVLLFFLDSLCSEPLDKIYGLQGIVHPDERLEVDYTVDPRQPFVKVVDAVAKSYFEDLDRAALSRAIESKLEDATSLKYLHFMRKLGLLLGIPRDEMDAALLDTFERARLHALEALA